VAKKAYLGPSATNTKIGSVSAKWANLQDSRVIEEARPHSGPKYGDDEGSRRSKEYQRILWKAYETGMRLWQYWYSDPLVDEVRARIREREWKRALGSLLVLLRYPPLGLTPLNERRIQAR